MSAGRKVVDNIVASGEVAYGINTGFGLFANVIVKPDELVELQENLIRSHAAGVGAPLTVPQTRMLLALRMNTLTRGHSGVRPETLQQMVDAFNADCLSVVPSKGTVGASGDLAPLSHLALGLMGEVSFGACAALDWALISLALNLSGSLCTPRCRHRSVGTPLSCDGNVVAVSGAR